MRLLRSAASLLPLFALLAPSVIAQGNNNNNNNNNAPPNLPDISKSDNKASSAAAPASKGSDSPTAAASKTDDADKNTASATPAPAASKSDTKDDDPKSATKDDNSKSSLAPTVTSPAASLPTMTTNKPALPGVGGGITNAPTLSGYYSYPPPTVPPTANAPFMQRSSLPQGTVFIAVGAALGAAFFVVLAWRGLVAWHVARRVQRAPGGRHNPFAKLAPRHLLGGGTGGAGGDGAVAPLRGKPFYTQVPGSTMSLNMLSGDVKAATYGKAAGAANASGSLFFSPTAAVTGAHSTSTLGMGSPSAAAAAAAAHTPGNRGSGYLPAGYYAAGASAVGGGVAGGGRPVSMADLTHQPAQPGGGGGGGSGGGGGARGSTHALGSVGSGGGGGHGPSQLNQSHTADGRTTTTRSPGPPSPGLINASTLGHVHPARHQTPELPYGRRSVGARLSTASLAHSEGRAPSAYLEDLFDVPPVPER